MRYRNDIDGLRALAVVPILVFHAGVEQLSGGFVGVDIFFVISGFLITSIITREIDQRRFSIFQFYHRRFVRILPALSVVMAAVLVASMFLLLPVEIKSVANSAVAAMTFVSNMFFWYDADYFAGAAESKPLLHTWSLGVEEQFYIFYPMLIILLKKYAPTKMAAMIAVLSLISFILCVVITFKTPTTAFYLLPTRAWELGLGALVALRFFPSIDTPSVRTIASVSGLAMILMALVIVQADKGFPGPSALLPCLGATLLIAYGEGTFIAKFLELGSMRWIGAISYSLYLWHWPLITFYRLQYGMHLTLPATVLLVAVSIIVAALSYYLVEQPFLRRFRHGSSRASLPVGAAVIAVISVLAVFVSEHPSSFINIPPNVERIASFSDYRDRPEYQIQFRKGPCFIGEGMRFDRQQCLAMKPGMKNVILLGDSHAAQYWRALSDHFTGYNVMQATASGCRPTNALIGAQRCSRIVDYVLHTSALRPNIEGVVLGGLWQPSDVEHLVSTVRELRGHGLKVTVIGPTVEYDGDLPILLARSMLQGAPEKVGLYRVKSRASLDKTMRPLIERAGGKYVSEIDIECPGGKCQVFDRAGGPYHFDYGHLTLNASRQVVDAMGTIF